MLGGVPTAFRPLRHRDFRLLWTGLAISLVGSGPIRDNLGGGAEDYGLALAAFGVGGPSAPWRSPRDGCHAAISRS